MAEFSVNIGRLRNDSISFQKIAGELKIISGDIQSVRRNVTSGSGGFDRIRLSLSNIGENVLNEAAASATLEEALQKILDAYESAETRNLERGKKGSDSVNDSSINNESDVINPMTGFVRYLGDLFYALTKNSNDQEKFKEALQDHNMSYTAQSYLNRPEYSEEAWIYASLQERKQMLTSLMHDLNVLMGLNVTIITFEPLRANNPGKYFFKDNSILINLDYIDPSNHQLGSYVAMQSIIHEMRHAYQWAAVHNPDQFNVSAETRRQWAYNYNHYIDGNIYGYEAYVEQPIEYDAKRFAGEYEDIKDYTPTYNGTW